MYMWQNACVNTVRHAMVCNVYFPFSKTITLLIFITLLKGLCAYAQYF